MSSLLLVEDNLSLCRMEARHIHAAFPDADLLVVHNGTDAERAVEERAFDAVIMDCKIPGRDCLALLDHITETIPDAAVIIVSADPPKPLLSGNRRHKIFDILEKPFEAEDFINALTRALGRPAAPGSPAEKTPSADAVLLTPFCNRHEMLNILAGMRLGIRAFELEVAEKAVNSPDIRETVEEYIPKILQMVERATALIKQAPK